MLWMFKVEPVNSRVGTTPTNAIGTASMTIKRVDEALELGGHQHVDQRQRHDDGDREVAPRGQLLLVLAAEQQGESFRQRHVRERGLNPLDRITQRDPALQVGAHVGHALAVDALDLDRPASPLPFDQSRQGHDGAGRRPQHDMVEVLGGEPVLRPQTDDDRKLIAALAVLSGLQPADVGEQGAAHLAHRQAELGDALAIEHQPLLGLALAAADVDVGDAVEGIDPAADVGGDQIGLFEVPTAQLDLERVLAPARAEDPIEHPQPLLRFDVDLGAGHLPVDRGAHQVRQLGAAERAILARLQLELDGRAVAAHLGGDDVDVAGRDHAANLAFELVEIDAGHRDVGAARHLDLDVDLVGVDARRQLDRDQRPDEKGEGEQGAGRREHPAAVADGGFESAASTAPSRRRNPR